MSSSLSDILQTGRSAMSINQLAMQVIGHNTANAGTEGFSRRRLELATALPSVIGDSWYGGNGVDIQTLGRVRDQLIDTQIQHAASGESFWNTRDQVLGEVESIYSELGDTAITDDLSQFWAAWHDLANDPESDAARYALREKATALTANMQRTHEALANRAAEIDKTIADRVDTINQLTGHLASLNQDIVRSLNSNQEPSDLLDQRDRVLEQLAGIMDINVATQDNGAIHVYSGGQILVQNTLSVPLEVTTHRTDTGTRTTITFGSFGREFVPESGELRALIDLRDGDLGDAMFDLDRFAVELANAVNGAHREGFGLNNAHGVDFFASGVTGAATLQVSSAIQDDIANIATGGSANAPGDNSLALRIAGLENQRLLNDGRSTLDEFYRQGVLNIASRHEHAVSEKEVYAGSAENLRARRQQVSGVSVDEEMSRLIQVQNAYEAAAKIVRTVDEMMQTVISIGA